MATQSRLHQGTDSRCFREKAEIGGKIAKTEQVYNA